MISLCSCVCFRRRDLVKVVTQLHRNQCWHDILKCRMRHLSTPAHTHTCVAFVQESDASPLCVNCTIYELTLGMRQRARRGSAPTPTVPGAL